ncbi:ankyrin repeat domain-containing protein [Legionella maceachernii]|uniref:Ankyrin repeat protein n=1 Tax=Legionella maceachernii TaxID=466 RepID=A0A0W0W1C6_9GAMM|nr:ankyrin repeat domain-containing protein [Legionella maceachernii]KTD26229.1 Ankyrin repeat protein [Legionella maceachernii]SKA10797.1 Ankyrin repeat-containing protein [Legionella maceachernii]SUO99536.1 Ankyrin repeat [Legionella maceachernii]
MKYNRENHKLIEIVTGIYPQVRPLKKILLEGADINYQDSAAGYTPLMFLVVNHHDRIAEYLLYQGANPLIKNYESKLASELISPIDTVFPMLKDFELLFAVLDNEFSAAENALAGGALINCRNRRSYTPLMIAVEQNQEEMVEFLLLQGATPSLTLANGQYLTDLTCNPLILDLLEEAKHWGEEMQVNIKKPTNRFFTAQRDK